MLGKCLVLLDMGTIHVVSRKRKSVQISASLRTGLNCSLRRERCLVATCEEAANSQLDDSLGVTGRDIVSWLPQWQPLVLGALLRDGILPPFCYNRAGESLYAQSYRHDNLEMMHYSSANHT